MSEPGSHKPFSPDDALPPVEPPSARFLVQLFLIPGLIVAIIVVVWLLFHWLAQMGNDPREYIKKLRGNSEMRWQAAVNLAGALHGEAGADIKKDPAVAADLAQILDDEIRAAGMDENSINMRIYLCRALGEFQTPLVLPALLKAAQTQRDDAEIDVRRAAVQGIAALAHTLDAMHPPLDDAEVVPVLIEATKSENNNLRAETAYALGEFDDPQATLRLEQMLDDPYPDCAIQRRHRAGTLWPRTIVAGAVGNARSRSKPGHQRRTARRQKAKANSSECDCTARCIGPGRREARCRFVASARSG